MRQFDGRMASEERRGSVPGVVRNSPDLIIENLWSQMKHLQYTKRATSIEGIMKMAQKVRNAITPSTSKALQISNLTHAGRH